MSQHRENCSAAEAGRREMMLLPRMTKLTRLAYFRDLSGIKVIHILLVDSTCSWQTSAQLNLSVFWTDIEKLSYNSPCSTITIF